MTYYVKEAKNGAIFVYPTDTIYGVWGIVTWAVVDKINELKQRLPGKHYSIIAPSFERIMEYFDVHDTIKQEWIDLYEQHWPLTLLLPLKSEKQADAPPVKGVVSGKADMGGLENINQTLLSPTDLIWVRYLPDHPIQQFVIELWEPLITTSANISGQPSVTHPDQLHDAQIKLIDYVILDNVLDGTWSTVINYSTWEKIR